LIPDIIKLYINLQRLESGKETYVPEKILPADWLQFIADAERDIKRPPAPPKRRQPKVTRHKSREQRIAESQTKNTVRAVYNPESMYNQTPTRPETFVGTKEVGPGDRNNSATNWRTGNMTIEPSINGNKTTKRPRNPIGQTRSGSTGNLDELLKEYGL